MTKYDDITLICPCNDLESVTILEIAKTYHIDTRTSNQAWGGKLGKEPEGNLQNLLKRVVVVELPDEVVEERLRSAGHDVIIIDHHDYSDLHRWRVESSLEQFCTLINHEMSLEELKVAINDKDFIPGLARMGVSYEEMKAIRQKEREITGVDHLFEEAFDYYSDHWKHFRDLDIVLAPERFRNVMGEVAQWPSKENYDKAAKNKQPVSIPNCLIIYHKDGNPEAIVRVNYYGVERLRPAFVDLMQDPAMAYFEMWIGRGATSCYWGAVARYPGEDKEQWYQPLFDTLLDRVLSFTLIDGRPLRYYWTTFLFPFRFSDPGYMPDPQGESSEVLFGVNKQGENTEKDINEIQEIIYFLPHVRDMLYKQRHDGGVMNCTPNGGEDISPARKWIIPVEQGDYSLEVWIDEKDEEIIPEKIRLPIEELALYRFFNDVHILSISLCKDTGLDIWKDRAFWRVLIDKTFQRGTTYRSLDDALTFNKLGRIVYQSFAEQPEEKKIANVAWLWTRDGDDERQLQVFKQPGISLQEEAFNSPLSNVVGEIVWRFFLSDAKRTPLEPLLDDRMFVHTCLALAGPKPAHRVGEQRYHAAFSLATCVDRFDDAWESQSGYAYDRNFVRELLQPLTYTRWYGVDSNLYGFTRFSAIYMAFDGYFHKTISKHVRTMYLRMSVVVLFYRASVVYYAHRTAQLPNPPTFNLMQKRVEEVHREVHDIHREMVCFANRHWFRELTYQDQGIEIFNLQRKAMDIEQEYEKARNDIERTYQFLDMQYQFLDMQYQSRFSKISEFVGIVALAFAIVAVVIGIFNMGFSTEIPIVGKVLGSETVLWGVITFIVLAIIVGFGIALNRRRK